MSSYRAVEVTVGDGSHFHQGDIYHTYNSSAAEERLKAIYDVPERILGDIGRWLQASTYEADLGRHGDKITGRDSNPAIWLATLEEFTAWKSGAQQRLWVAGRPGCGKSVLASSVINELLNQHAHSSAAAASETFAGFAFGSKTDDAKKPATALVKGILWQLATWKSLTLDQRLEIASYWTSMGARSAYSANSSDDGIGPLLRTLSAWLELFKHVYLVFDGLDECEDAEALLRGLVRLSPAQPNVRILLISQPTPAISNILRSECMTVDMDAANIRSHTETDIRAYVRSEIIKHGDESITTQVDDVSREIVQRSDGIFLWAVFATAELTSRSLSSPHQLLKSINQLPRKMNSLFLYLLDRILRPDPSLPGIENDQRKNTILVLLRWVFHSGRPMSLTELQIAMGVPQHLKVSSLSMTASAPSLPALRKLAQLCYPIISLQDDKPVLLHATFKDFVLPSSMAFSTEVAEVLGSAEVVISIIDKCLAYLESDQFDFFDFISIPKTEVRARFPFFEYACTSFVTLLEHLPQLPSWLDDRIAAFLRSDNAISWLESWQEFAGGDFSTLQSVLYASLTTKHPTWVLDLLIRCVEERKEHDAKDIQTSNMAFALSRLYKNCGRIQDAYNEFQSVYEMRKQQEETSSLEILTLKHELGGILGELGRLDEAWQCYEEILPLYRGLFGPEDERCLITRCNMAYVCSLKGNLAEAETIHRDCYSIRQRTLGERASKTLDTATDLLLVLRRLGKLSEGKALCAHTKLLAMEESGDTSNLALRLDEAAAMFEMDLDNMDEALRIQSLNVDARNKTVGPGHPFTLRAKNNLASILETMTRFEEAGAILQELVPAFQALIGPTHRMTLTAINNLATNLEHQGRTQESLRLHEENLRLQIETQGRTHPDTLLAMNNTANTRISHGPLSGATTLLAEAVNSALTTLGLCNSLTRSLLSNLSSLCLAINLPAAAEHVNAVHRELIIAAVGERHSDLMDAETVHIAILRRQCRWSEAGKVEHRCLRILKKRGATDEKYLMMQQQQASLLRDQGLFDEAEKITNAVVAAKEATYGVDHRLTLHPRMLLGVIYIKQGRTEDASRLLSAVYQSMCDWTGADSGKAIGCSVNVAEVYRREGELEQAEALLRAALTYYAENFGSQYDDTSLVRERLAMTLCDQGKLAEAEEQQRLALAGRKAALAPSNPVIASCQSELARILFRRGNASEASRLVVPALDGMIKLWSMGHPEVQRAQETFEWVRGAASGVELTSPTQEVEAFCVAAHREMTELLGGENRLTLRLEAQVATYLKSRDQLKDVFDKQARILGHQDADTLATLDEMLPDLDADALTTEQMRPCLTWAINAKDDGLLKRLVKHGALTSPDSPTSYTPLAFSISTDQIECMKALLEYGADVNHIEHDSESAVLMATRKASVPMLTELLEYGADVNACNDGGLTALWIASEAGNLDAAKKLLAAGARNIPRSDGLHPLHIAAAQGYIEILEASLAAGADIECTFNGGTPLHVAAIQCQLETIKYLHQRGASVDTPDDVQVTPLHDACKRGYHEIVAFLLEQGADLGRHSQAGHAPIHYAVESGSIDVFEALVRAGADIGAHASTAYGLTPLAMAAAQGQGAILQWLLDRGVDANEKLGDDITALFFAANSGSVEAINCLLKAGADVNARSIDGQQALHEAIINGGAAAATALIQAGADASARLKNNFPLLVFAVATQQEELVDVLIKAPGIDLDAAMANGLTALHLACYFERLSLVTKLLNRGAEINCVDLCRESPLHLACGYRRYDVINILLRRGADTALCNFAGQRPIDYASDVERICAWFGCAPAPFALDAVHRDAVRQSLQLYVAEARTATGPVRPPSLFNAIARCLFNLGASSDGIIALEQCITENEDRAQVEHDAICNMCPASNVNGIAGTAYFCISCTQSTALCGDCMVKYGDTEHPRWCRGHAFVSVPREVWKTLQSGEFDQGQTKAGWLDSVEQRFADAQTESLPYRGASEQI